MSEQPIVGAPTDEQMSAYLEGRHGPPSGEVVAIVQAELLAAALAPASSPEDGAEQ